MKITYKLPAYALIYTLIISSIITLIASFILMQISNAKALEIKRNTKTKLIEAEKNLIRLALHKHLDKKFENGNPFSIQLYDNIQSQIKTEVWGALKVFSFENRSHSDSLFSYAFAGQKDYSFRNTAIYLSDNNQPLNMSGKSEIRGNASLPAAGIKASIVNGEGYKGDHMIDGDISKSSNQLPELQISELRNFIESYELDQFEYSKVQDSLSHSFGEKALHLHFGENAFLGDCFYKGHIILSARQNIYISKAADLEDVIIIASQVEIEKGSILSAQIFAYESIDISEDVILDYPSLLYLERKNEDGNIKIGNRAKIEGLLITEQADSKNRNPLIILEKDAEVKGLIYSQGITDTDASITGTLISDNLQYTGKGSLYFSCLYNSVINNNALPKYFVLPELFAKRTEKNIMKWLD